MKRFLSTVYWDIQLQFRNGFYYASAFVAVLFIIMLKQLPDFDPAIWWPVILLENLVVNTFYFLAGLVLLEKAEGTLEAQVVTPLRPGEYLFSKVLSLGVLSLIESLVVIAVVSGLGFNPLLVLGVMLLAAMYTLYGFVVVSRYDSITDFILPSALWVMWFSLPLLYTFDVWKTDLMFIHPLQAPIMVMKAGFTPVPAWQILYGVSYSLLWIGVGYIFSRQAFHRFVIRKEGTKRR